MTTAAFLLPWIVIGGSVVWFAFQGGPQRARQRYDARRGGRAFRVLVPLFYVTLGVSIPAVVIADRGDDQAGTRAANASVGADQARGKQLFRQNCASCHTLAAVNARGTTGPNLDQLGALDERRVANAIRIGGSGEDLMPAGLVEGADAKAVARFVADNAGR